MPFTGKQKPVSVHFTTVRLYHILWLVQEKEKNEIVIGTVEYENMLLKVEGEKDFFRRKF